MILNVITLKVSNTGIVNTANTNGTKPKLSGKEVEIIEPVFKIFMTKEERIAPIKSVPPSPINILDLLPKTLCKKNGIREPTDIIANDALIISPDKENNMLKMRQAIIQ